MPSSLESIPRKSVYVCVYMHLCAHVFCVNMRKSGVAEGTMNLGTEVDEVPGRW